MIGRTNVGGGNAEQWYAAIVVTTDANASITAVNPRGNSYTRQADSSGSLTILVAYPGTYTISETGATSQTVVVADYGVSYPVSIYAVPVFTGVLINDGSEQVSFKSMGITGFNPPSKPLTISYNTILVYGDSYNIVNAAITDSSNGGAGAYVTQEAYDLSGYTALNMIGRYGDGSNRLIIIQENQTSITAFGNISTANWGTFYLALTTGIDLTKKYHCGIAVIDSNAAYMEVNKLWLS